MPLVALIDNNECVGCEAEVSNHIEGLEEQWAELLDKIAEKGQKLREANQQQQYNEAVKDIDFWLGGLEAQLASEDCGRDLAAVQNLLKKHHLLEADIAAHEVHFIRVQILLLLLWGHKIRRGILGWPWVARFVHGISV